MHDHKASHWIAVKRILRYLKSTINHDIFFSKNSSFYIHAYANVNGVGCLNDKCSVKGFCMFLDNHLISWTSCKQHIVVHSSTKVEYKSFANSTHEIIWLKKLLSQAPTLWCDNLEAIYLTFNLVFHFRTKHMDINFYIICDRVAAKALLVNFCSNKD